ncbi:MAG: C40 family peptidase [Desulfobacteraceae bacterium]|nr:C40 family peptidase [Desulfobacteraceae bacterium]MBC2754242.1 C40 family peptidase [Desulfobacteraceae bacterium]
MIAGCGSFSKRKHYNSSLGEKIVKIAVRYKGFPYKYGGTTPKGFDCSGFTSYVFKKAGIEIPRTAGAQYRQGSSVSKSDLKKGDLVFFTRWGLIGKIFSPGHVGIYIGNDRFIHAPSKGGKVRIDLLNNVYWKRNYKGAVDLL